MCKIIVFVVQYYYVKGWIALQHVLIVEDEARIADLIEMTLTRAGYSCQKAADGIIAADLLQENDYDLVLLDIMLPGYNGYDLIEYIKPIGIPVIFLTAKGELKDRVRGLRLGADDYIVKPFEPMELVARVETVLRRFGKSSGILTAWDVQLDITGYRVTQNGKEINLTPREFALLELMIRNKGIALYRDVLFERVWGTDDEETTRTLDLHILRLRKKLDWKDKIKTIHKIGYMLEKEQ